MSSEETATAQMLWAGEITAECYGPRWSGNPKRARKRALRQTLASVSVVHASPQAESGAQKKAGSEV